ncbi:AAA family ATPase [Thermodesulfobacteriota bacterium]
MKIAISGKGGVGKTTFAGTLSRFLAAKGDTVLAIDADPDANLASALGFPDELVKDLEPIANMVDLIEERTGAKKGTMGGMFSLTPKVDDIPYEFSAFYHNVRLLRLGTIQQAGTGCFCPESALLKNLINYLFIGQQETLIVDMEAGIEHLTRGSTAYVDMFIVTVEPGLRSIQTAFNIKELAEGLGIKKVYVVANKVNNESDKALIESKISGKMELLGCISYNPKIIEADMKGVAPYDLDEKIKDEISVINDRIEELRGAK